MNGPFPLSLLWQFVQGQHQSDMDSGWLWWLFRELVTFIIEARSKYQCSVVDVRPERKSKIYLTNQDGCTRKNVVSLADKGHQEALL